MDNKNTTYIVISLLIGLVVGVFGGWYYGQTNSNTYSTATTGYMNGATTSSKTNFSMAMRKLWEDHVTWTRLSIISILNNSPDTDATVNRLLANASDMGNVIQTYYGQDAATKFSQLIKDHLTIAADLVKAAKAGNQGDMASAEEKWIMNADEIAKLLSDANPNLTYNELKEMLHEHLSLTKQEAVDYYRKNYTASIADYDKIHAQALTMADGLSAAIIKQFPDKFQ